MKTVWSSIIIVLGFVYMANFNHSAKIEQEIKPLEYDTLSENEIEMHKMKVNRLTSEIEVLHSEINYQLSKQEK